MRRRSGDNGRAGRGRKRERWTKLRRSADGLRFGPAADAECDGSSRTPRGRDRGWNRFRPPNSGGHCKLRGTRLESGMCGVRRRRGNDRRSRRRGGGASSRPVIGLPLQAGPLAGMDGAVCHLEGASWVPRGYGCRREGGGDKLRMSRGSASGAAGAGACRPRRRKSGSRGPVGSCQGHPIETRARQLNAPATCVAAVLARTRRPEFLRRRRARRFRAAGRTGTGFEAGCRGPRKPTSGKRATS